VRGDRVTTRRAFIGTLTGGLVAAPLAASAQQPAKVPRIGFLATNLAANPSSHEAFLQGLRDLGYVEGRDVVIEYRDGEGKDDRLPALAVELAALKVDVIVAAAGTLPALAAKQATRTVPIVFIAVGDPVTSALVTSLARPGGNLTGLSAVSPELASKWLELLKQAVSRVSRVAFLWQPGALGGADKEVLKEAEVAARALGVRLQFVEARGPADIDRAFSEMTRARTGALAVLSTPMFASERRRLLDLAAKNRLPTMFSFRGYVDAGGLMSYGPNLADLFRRAATYVDKILKGAKPADLPVEQPTKFELVINLKTAKALGLTIPPSLLQRADEVIQ
jgi:putative ABC transport system substrate-binding protein